MRSSLTEDLEHAWAACCRTAPCEVSIELRKLDRSTLSEPGYRRSGLSDGAGTVIANRREDVEHYAASTLKVAVLIAALDQMDTGTLDPRRSLKVASEFPSAAQGTFNMRQDDDQDDDTWSDMGGHVPVRDLLERMTIMSSNIATNIVLTHIGLRRVREVLERAHAPSLALRRLIGDDRGEQQGVTNIVTVRGLTQLWAALGQGWLLSQDATRETLALLARQQHTQMIPAGLPPGIWVASKGGWTTSVKHDVALVRPSAAPPYVFAVCTSTSETFDARPLVARLSEITWQHWTR